MKLLILFLPILFPLSVALGQDIEIGKSKSQIENEAEADGKKLTQGMNDDGVVYLMQEAWDGVVAWYFNDELICTHFYLCMRSQSGRDHIVQLRIDAGQKGEKIDNNTYVLNGIKLKFSNPSSEEIAVLIFKE